jgi:phenylalanyl-tRNA synthetase beta chain
MKISTHWLREYVEHDLAPGALAERLTMAGLEVDSRETVGFPLEGVVVGRVAAVKEHPNADRLVLCQVDLGAGGDPVQIACGAPNVAEGQRVPVATPGATLMMPSRDDPDETEPVTIEETTLRGEPSKGMICAEDELGLSDDHSGVMVLPSDAEVGQPFADYLRANDVTAQDEVLDIEITPDRPDATSHVGVARDVAAITDRQLALPRVDVPDEGGETAEAVSVHLDAPEGCPRYAAMIVRGVEVGPSPLWLRRRLLSIGLRPQNNVVDVTNFVLHEIGQPLHAFDLNRLAGPEIRVREADDGESFTTLDGVERDLPGGSLLICDAERPVALAGVMGGQNSEVTADTTDVLIESAYFDPAATRRTAKALQLQTDASYRFERGVDPTIQPWAAARAARLIADLGGGDVTSTLVDEKAREYEPRVVGMRPVRANQLLGLSVPTPDMIDLLEAVGFTVQQEDPLDKLAEHALEGHGVKLEAEDVVLRCTVPPFRPDVTREADLIEEVARLHGYDEIPLPERTSAPSRPPRESPATALRRRTRRRLTGLGFREIYTNSLLPQERAERFNTAPLVDSEGDVVETLNPQSEEMAAMRPSLLPGLLEAARHNQNRRQRALRFVEWGHVYRRAASDDNLTFVSGFSERENLIVGMSGPRAQPGWDAPGESVDFYDLRGTVEALLEDTLRIGGDVAFEPAGEPSPLVEYHVHLEIEGGERLGLLARLGDEAAQEFDLDEPFFFAELHWKRLARLAASRQSEPYDPISRFPVVERDLAVLVSAKQPVGPLLGAIRKAGQPLLNDAGVFDLYEGKNLPDDKKSVAFTLKFGAHRTLTDDEVAEQMNTILERLSGDFGAKLRQ